MPRDYRMTRPRSELRKKLMQDINTPLSALIEGTKDSDGGVRCAAFENPKMTMEYLLIGSKDEFRKVRCAIMKKPDASEEILLIGSQDACWEVRSNVMASQNISEELLIIGSCDESSTVRRSVMYNIKTPVHLLIKGCEDPATAVRCASMSNPGTPIELLINGCLDEESRVRSSVLESVKNFDNFNPVDCKNDNYMPVIFFLDPERIFQADEQGNTLMMEACMENNEDAVLYLYEKGCDVYQENNDGISPYSILSENKNLSSGLKALLEKLDLEKNVEDESESSLGL